MKNLFNDTLITNNDENNDLIITKKTIGVMGRIIDSPPLEDFPFDMFVPNQEQKIKAELLGKPLCYYTDYINDFMELEEDVKNTYAWKDNNWMKV